MLFRKQTIPDNGEVARLCRQLSDSEAETILNQPEVRELIERQRARRVK